MSSTSMIACTAPRATGLPGPLARLAGWVARRIDACRRGPSDAEILARMDPRLLADIGIDPVCAVYPDIHPTGLITGWSR